MNIITPIQNQFICYKDEIKENKGKENVIKKRKKRERGGRENRKVRAMQRLRVPLTIAEME